MYVRKCTIGTILTVCDVDIEVLNVNRGIVDLDIGGGVFTLKQNQDVQLPVGALIIKGFDSRRVYLGFDVPRKYPVTWRNRNEGVESTQTGGIPFAVAGCPSG